MREEMQMMKKYLVLCLDACTQGLPWKIGLRTHMIENSGNYSIKDLIDLQSGILLDELRAAYDTMLAHITQQCELCKARWAFKKKGCISFISSATRFLCRIHILKFLSLSVVFKINICGICEIFVEFFVDIF